MLVTPWERRVTHDHRIPQGFTDLPPCWQMQTLPIMTDRDLPCSPGGSSSFGGDIQKTKYGY